MSESERLGLTAHQHAIGARVVAEESSRREHLVVYLSGAHAYGFPSPDSDLDLKAVHIAPTRSLLGFGAPSPTFDRAEVIEEVEIDYTSNELGLALSGILQGNGNFLERVLGRTAFTASPLRDELAPLVRAVLSRRTHRHYRGFASSQLKELEKKPTVKKLLYVLRTAMTGMHLLRAGELEADLGRLVEEHSGGDLPERDEVKELVAQKRAGERTAADPALLDAWRPKLDRVLAALDASYPSSALPEAPDGEAIDDLEAWLVETRAARLR